ncbi:hemolymph lipopolysaccharide-binding protein-like [Periplaneta americana]|uniref:hemolymph lipopolysaccharide-binding protein-like n=1 Tax=Periplaneta americana TaxID=6978 RepID=UPI0037E9B78E
MFRCLVFCCLLWSAGAQECDSRLSNALKFSITSLRNQTGHWIAQVEHGAGKKEAGPWVLDIDHKTANCEDSEAVLIAATVTAPPADKTSLRALGYDLIFGFGYYKLHTNVKTWEESQEVCKHEGTHFLVVNTDQEARALKTLWDNTPKIPKAAHNDWAWAGFHDQFKEGEYLTIFNETLKSAGYAKWNAQEPSGTNQNCGSFGRNLLLADYPCYNKLAFFCEQELL